jgi:hypothetical protein
VIDREMNDAFDGLFIGGDMPETVAEALHRLPDGVRARVLTDEEARQSLAELVWMSKALRVQTPRPSASFADRTAEAAFRQSAPTVVRPWKLTMAGTVVAAAVLLAVGVAVWRPRTEQPAAPPAMVKNDGPLPSSAEPPTLALLDQVKKMMPKIPSEMPLGTMQVSLGSKPQTTSLAQAFAAPAGNIADVGKTLGKEVRPIRDSVRDAFAFLGDFPPREKRSL